eukprot:NODE_1418_length_2483_cov_5.893039.p1 GENE.NODE_1418_length_2483_cov_5.893039~~NODE_1418_length_2483_cov_5.893039.p1  ORF type:complete len:725 (-),score=173.24 NODE_1418_length_2483_cov_5.893039:307-2250(-)
MLPPPLPRDASLGDASKEAGQAPRQAPGQCSRRGCGQAPSQAPGQTPSQAGQERAQVPLLPSGILASNSEVFSRPATPGTPGGAGKAAALSSRTSGRGTQPPRTARSSCSVNAEEQNQAAAPRQCFKGPPREPRAAAATPPAPSARGAACSDDPVTRQMLDKNTLRSRHRELFTEAVHRYRVEETMGPGIGRSAEPPATTDLTRCMPRPSICPVKVYARKRPLNRKEEVKLGEYDILSVMSGDPLPRRLVLHNCLFEADLKTPFINHVFFEFDHVFGQSAEDAEVYRVTSAEHVAAARNGGVGTVLMFGQTGSGKTHTMTAIESMAARDLFQGAEVAGATAGPWLSLRFVELRGNRCFDLLAPRERQSAFPELRVREHTSGSYIVEDATEVFPRTPAELCRAMSAGHARRSTSATDANSTSSRSHAVCMLQLTHSGGQLMLVDCAGTEWRKDSAYHSRERQQEGAEINASLYALKECIRYRVSEEKVPSHAYRASTLTKVLADAFMNTGDGCEATFAVICTASPCASDTEHTMATLRAGASLAGHGSEREEKESLLGRAKELKEQHSPQQVHPKQWEPEQVRTWLAANKAALGKVDVPLNFTGQMLVRLPEARCAQLCGGDARRGRRFYELLHEEMRKAETSRKQSR